MPSKKWIRFSTALPVVSISQAGKVEGMNGGGFIVDAMLDVLLFIPSRVVVESAL